jgi:type IV pilus assembly protein PilW
MKKLNRVNPVRNSSRSTQRLSTGGGLNPALRGGTPYGAEPGIILKSNPAAAAGSEGLWPRREQRGIISNGVNAKGITLIELLVALVICGIVIAGTYRLFVAQSKAYTVQDQVVEVQQSIRSAMEILLRDLRMAGFDSDNVGSKISIANPLIAGDNSTTVSFEYDNTTQYTITYTREAATKRLLRQLTTTKDDGSSIAGPKEALLENVEVLDFTYGVDTNDDGAMDGGWVPAATVIAGNLKVVAVHVVLTAKPDQTNPDVKNWISPRTLNSAVTIRNLCFKK